MCGIIACRTDAPAVDYLLSALKRLEYRGYDSAGVAVGTTAGEVVRLRRAGRIHVLEEAVRTHAGAQLDGVGIGHTRWATHGPATEANAHPHVDCSGRFSVVHNGIIEDADELRHALQRRGHRFASEVDSEVLCHLIEDEARRTDDLVAAVRAALSAVRGAWAVAVLERGTGRIVVAAHRSPLLVARNGVGVFAASDVAAMADWVEEFRALADGEVFELTDDDAWRIRGGPAIDVRRVWRRGDAELDGHADFMAKEIAEQPNVAARVVDALGPRILDGSLWHDTGVGPLRRLQVVGCGTSLNAGRVIRNVAAALGRIPVTLSVASEAATDLVEPGTTRLAISQSGETADVLSALDGPAAAALVALTNNPHSTLARRADAVLDCSAGPEIGVAATKTFVCQMIVGIGLVVAALVADGRLDARHARTLVDELRRLPARLAATTTMAEARVGAIAADLAHCSGFIYVARGNGLPYAAEGALKLKELSYRWAEHHPAGELKHGPLALVDHGTPVIVIDNGDPKLAGNVAEIRARHGRVVIVGGADGDLPTEGGGYRPWGPIESVVPLQLLARGVAVALGRDVDKPRNLAKAVTVE